MSVHKLFKLLIYNYNGNKMDPSLKTLFSKFLRQLTLLFTQPKHSVHFINLIYLLLTEFEVRSVSYGPSFFPLIYGPSAKRLGHKSTGKKREKNGKKTGENEVSKIFIISLRLTGARARKLVKVKRKAQLPQIMPCQNPKN